MPIQPTTAFTFAQRHPWAQAHWDPGLRQRGEPEREKCYWRALRWQPSKNPDSLSGLVGLYSRRQFVLWAHPFLSEEGSADSSSAAVCEIDAVEDAESKGPAWDIHKIPLHAPVCSALSCGYWHDRLLLDACKNWKQIAEVKEWPWVEKQTQLAS